MRHISIIIMGLLFTATSCMPAQSIKNTSLVCYGDFLLDQVNDMEYVIVEPQFFSPSDVRQLKQQNEKVLAYISLGEINKSAASYPEIKEETLDYNKIWNSYVIDIAAPKTRAVLLENIVRHLELQGFDGLFLDNIDNYTIYGPTPHRAEELYAFLKEIKSRFSKSVIMQNAGLLITDQTAPYIDAIAIESVASDYDFKENEYQMRSTKVFKERMSDVQSVHLEHQIPFLLIEYAATKKMRNQIHKKLKKYDLPVFVGQIDLQKFPEFQ